MVARHLLADLAFLFGVLLLMALDYPTGTFTVAALRVMMVMLAVGWLVLKGTNSLASTYFLTRLVDDEAHDPR